MGPDDSSFGGWTARKTLGFRDSERERGDPIAALAAPKVLGDCVHVQLGLRGV